MLRLPPTEPLIRPAVLLAVVLTCAACGRSAPADSAAAADSADPAIAGVVVTSPDTIVPAGPGAPTAPAPTTTSPPAAPVTVAIYTVESGDTLSTIASRYGITTSALAAANAIVDVNSIKPGQELVIPPPAVDDPKPVAGSSAPSSTATGGLRSEPTVIRPEPVDPGATTSLRQP